MDDLVDPSCVGTKKGAKRVLRQILDRYIQDDGAIQRWLEGEETLGLSSSLHLIEAHAISS